MVEKISRSEQKRLFKQVEELAVELSILSDNDLKKMELEIELKEEIMNCRGLKAGAKKRQIKYLAKILRQYPLAGIYQFLKAKKGSELKKNHILHSAERWRDIIINEAMELHDSYRREQVPFEPSYPTNIIVEALAEFPGLNESEMRRCAFQYIRTRNKTYYRELFRMVKAAIEMEERKNTQ